MSMWRKIMFREEGVQSLKRENWITIFLSCWRVNKTCLMYLYIVNFTMYKTIFENCWVSDRWRYVNKVNVHGENFMAIFTTLSVVIWFYTGTLGIFPHLSVLTMCVVMYDILSMTIIPTLSTSILFCNLCYILLWISPRSVVKIAMRI